MATQYKVCVLSKNIDNLSACIPAVASSTCRPLIAFSHGSEAPLSFPGRHMCDVTGQKWKEFGYSREMNRLIRMAGPFSDVVLLNDDAVLQTPDGFDELSKLANENPEYGVLSAAVTGMVKRDQRRAPLDFFGPPVIRESQDRALSFICIYIRREILERVGLLDERFTPNTYGFQDNDYCERVTRAGWKLGIVDSVVVEHGSLPSTYRPVIARENAGNEGSGNLRDQLMRARGVFAGIWGEELANTHWPLANPATPAKQHQIQPREY